MDKSKKVGIRYYLNKRLKPSIVAGEERYPLYVQLTFNRMTAQFKCPLLASSEDKLSEKEFEYLLEKKASPDFNRDIRRFEEEIDLIISIEQNYRKEELKLKGFAQKIDFYAQKSVSVLEYKVNIRLIEYTEEHISKELADNLSPDQYNFGEITKFILAKADKSQAHKLIAELRIPLLAYLYLVIYSQKVISPTVSSWFGAGLMGAEGFKNFLYKYMPLDNPDQKKVLDPFPRLSSDSSIAKLYNTLDFGVLDIPLVVKFISITIIQ